MQETHYDAFISYRHINPDAQVAAKLARQIENYRIPRPLRKQVGKKRMGKVFLDHDELPTSADLGSGIESALAASDCLIAVSSPEYPKSRWCMKEVDTFIAQGKREKILTVLVNGEPEQSFPPALMFVPNPDGTVTEVEPLAADVRALSTRERDRKLKVEKLRLLAPMLGVGFDDLRRRHRERVIRMLVLISLSVALGGVVFGTYAYSNAVTIARQSAELQKTNDALTLANTEVEIKNEALSKTNAELDSANLTLADTNTALESANTKLEDTNAALENANTQLADTNTALETANTQLEEANRVLEAQKQQIVSQRDKALISQSRFLSDAAQSESGSGNPMLGMLLALEALPVNLENPERPYTNEAEIALRGTLAKLNSNVYSMYSSVETQTNKQIEDYSYTNHLRRNYIAVSGDDTEIYSIERGELSAVLPAAERKKYAFSTGGDYAAYIRKFDENTNHIVVRDLDNGNECYAEIKYPDAPQICSSGIENIFSDVTRVAVKDGSNTLNIYSFNKGFRDGDRLAKLCSIAVNLTQNNYVDGYAWCPDGKRIIIWTRHGLEVYDADDGKKLAVINGNEGGFSKNGRMIYAVDGGFLKLYDGATYELVYSFDNDDEKLLKRSQSLDFQQILRRFSPDGSLIVYPAQDGRLRVYSCETGEITQILSVPSVNLTWADWNFTGNRILAVGGGKTFIFEVKSGKLLQKLEPEEAVNMAFFVNNSDVICTLAQKRISFWAHAPGDAVYFGDENSQEFTFSSDGRYLYHLRGYPNYTAFAVDTVTGETVKGFGWAIWFEESPDGKTLAVYRTENDIDLYTVGKWEKPYRTLHYNGGHDDYYYYYDTPAGDMSFSPDGKKLVMLNNIWDKIVIFDVETGGAKVLLEGDDFNAYFDSYGIGLKYIPVYWNEDGTEIAAVQTEPYLDKYCGGVTINVNTGAIDRIPAGVHYERSPDGLYYLKLNISESVLKVYSARTGELIYSLGDCDWACFGNGGLILTTNEDAALTTVRKASSGETISSFEETTKHSKAPYSWYGTSCDGKYISVTSNDVSARHAVIRLASTGEAIQEIPEAWKLIWSPVDDRYAIEVSGTVMNSSISYITQMRDLPDVIKTAREKLGGRVLTDKERAKYWLDQDK